MTYFVLFLQCFLVNAILVYSFRFQMVEVMSSLQKFIDHGIIHQFHNVIIDIGAMDGIWTHYLTDSEIFPASQFVLIDGNSIFNQYFIRGDNIQTITSLVGEKDDEFVTYHRFSSPQCFHMNSRHFIPSSTCHISEKYDIEERLSYSLDTILEHGMIDDVTILFMDVQGGEIDILKGCEKLLRQEKSPLIVIEIENYPMSNSSTFSQVTYFLEQRGYQFLDAIPSTYDSSGIVLKLVGFWKRRNNLFTTVASPPPLEGLALRYNEAVLTQSDINEHMELLYSYAKQSQSILELGVSKPVSTWAFMQGLVDNGSPIKYLHSCDINRAAGVLYCEMTAKAVGVEFKFTTGSDLELSVDHLVDLTFIDTLHVYGQLKRELAMYAPLTKKWIIMHDTAVDAIEGEIVRNKWSTEKWENITGIPVDELRKGLYPAIDEFLVAHGSEWAIETVKTNNNGITVLRRISEIPHSLQKEILPTASSRGSNIIVVVTSVLRIPSDNPTVSSIYSLAERYQHTEFTIQSIRQVFPDATICMIEGSSLVEFIPGVDYLLRIPDPSVLNRLEKGMGESYLVEQFLRSSLFDTLKQSGKFQLLMKISGRYHLNPEFSIDRISTTKISAHGTYDSVSNARAFDTILYFVPLSLVNMLMEELPKARDRIGTSVSGNLEQALFPYFPKDIMNDVDLLGVSGYQAPTGKWIHL